MKVIAVVSVSMKMEIAPKSTDVVFELVEKAVAEKMEGLGFSWGNIQLDHVLEDS